jgi:hypothetical protein
MAAASVPALSHHVTQRGVHYEAGEIKIWESGGGVAVGDVCDREIIFARNKRVDMGRRR